MLTAQGLAAGPSVPHSLCPSSQNVNRGLLRNVSRSGTVRYLISWPWEAYPIVYRLGVGDRVSVGHRKS